MKYYCYDQDGLYATLHELAELDLPVSLECKPIKNTEWSKKHRQFEAMINTVAKHNSWGHDRRERFKKSAKIKWGKVEGCYDDITGQRAWHIPSIMDYSISELRTLIGELDVWCAENEIQLER